MGAGDDGPGADGLTGLCKSGRELICTSDELEAARTLSCLFQTVEKRPDRESSVQSLPAKRPRKVKDVKQIDITGKGEHVGDENGCERAMRVEEERVRAEEKIARDEGRTVAGKNGADLLALAQVCSGT